MMRNLGQNLLRWLMLAAVLLSVGTPLTSVVGHTASPVLPAGPENAARRILIKVRSDVAMPAGRLAQAVPTPLTRVLTAQGVTTAQALFNAAPRTMDSAGLERIYRLELTADANITATVAALNANPALEWAEPDYLARAAVIPNDPLYAGQWGLEKIAAPTAWDVVTGTPTVVIAVIDSGIDLTHPDLASRLWINPGEIVGNGLDDDNNGYVDDARGWNFVAGSNDVYDGNGHGTQVAGVAAAATNDGQGIAGVCWHCRIMPVKVMADSGISNYSDIALGVKYAADKGAHVINLSLGGYAYSNALRDAINYAVAKGAVVVGGAGNDNLSTPFYPAAYPDVLAVAGTTLTDTKATFSDYGPWVDLSAPAVAITTTYLGGDWGPANGTSLAAPFVAGVAALVRSQRPEWSAALVRNQLLQTADALDALNPAYAGQLGAGRVSAAQATQNPHPVLVIAGTSVNGDPVGRPIPGETATLAVTLRNDWWDATNVTGILSTTDPYVAVNQTTASYGVLASGASGTSSPVYNFTVAAGTGYNYPIPLTLEVSANDGAYTATFPLTMTTRSGDEHFCGTVAEDMVWTSDKRYLIDCNVGIAPGYTLTIQAGTEVRFNGNYGLNVGGTLIADGTITQPIRLMANGGSSWRGIRFDDLSMDAYADTKGNYLSGNLLRHVVIDGSTGGIEVSSATPYLAHLTMTATMVVSGELGMTPLWLLDSQVSGQMVVGGAVTVQRTSASSLGGWHVWGEAAFLSNTLDIQSLGIGGANGRVIANALTGSLEHMGSRAQVLQNTFTSGAIYLGDSATVLSNTLRNGGISVGNGGVVRGNNIENAPVWGIQLNGNGVVEYNRIVGCVNGVQSDGGEIRGNLVANISRVGLDIGSTVVTHNTFTGIGGSAVKITAGTVVTLTDNNFEFNTGVYDVEDLVPQTILATVDARNNWWGTTSGTVIQRRIYDFYDGDFTLGTVLYVPTLTAPDTSAPAYVRAITLTPESPVGIQTVTFDVLFSREMDTNSYPTMVFHTTRRGTFEIINGPSQQGYSDMVFDSDDNLWFGAGGGWVRSPSGTFTQVIGPEAVEGVALDIDGSKWFGGMGLWHLSSNMTLTTVAAPRLWVSAIAVDMFGNKWVSTNSDSRDDGGTVNILTTAGIWITPTLPTDGILSMAFDTKGNGWFGTRVGIWFRRPNGEWQPVTGGPGRAYAIAFDRRGNTWFGGETSAWRLSSQGIWTQFYMPCLSVEAGTTINGIAMDSEDNIWFGNGWPFNVNGPGCVMRVLHHGQDFSVVTNMQWLTPERYRATYDITALIRREPYSITISGVQTPETTGSGSAILPIPGGGMEIPPNSAYTFTVDYAGYINDITAPPAPSVTACAAATPDALSANWSAYDPESTIDKYQYAIGTTTGGSEVISWIPTTLTETTHVSLILAAGQTYYFSVKARNEGGLWSAPASVGVVAGADTCVGTELPPPQADFTATPRNGDAPFAVQFTSVVTGEVTAYAWSFGDAGVAIIPNPTHTYTSAGSFGVTLVVTGPGGAAQAVKPGYITVNPPAGAPTTTFSADVVSGTAPLTVTFTAVTSGTVEGWQWNFGDGEMATTGPAVQHTYLTPGVFGVRLTVSNTHGSYTVNRPEYITVTTPLTAPVADFTATPLLGPPPLTVHFMDASDGDITAWAWDFGDHGSSTVQNPVHEYGAAGAYTVTLTVSGPGGSDTRIRAAYIHVTAEQRVYLPLVLRNATTASRQQ